MIDAVLSEQPDRKSVRIACESHELTHRTPILAMCRRLVEEGYPPEAVMRVKWANGRPSMCVVIGRAAKLTVTERDGKGLHREPFRKYPEKVRGDTVDGDVGQEAA